MVESDDRLLLREFAHRTGNDLAAALAAMRLSASGTGPHVRATLVEDAIARLEASSVVHLLLAAPVRRQVDVGELVRDLCRGLADARPEAARSRMVVDASEMVVDGDVARRMALVAAELVANAIRHSLAGRAGVLTVRVDRVHGRVRLVVADDGAGMRPGSPRSGTGLGRGIVSDLVGRGGGSLAVETGPAGTVVEVLLPLRANVDSEADIAF